MVQRLNRCRRLLTTIDREQESKTMGYKQCRACTTPIIGEDFCTYCQDYGCTEDACYCEVEDTDEEDYDDLVQENLR